jgi:hypothetical protein
MISDHLLVHIFLLKWCSDTVTLQRQTSWTLPTILILIPKNSILENEICLCGKVKTYSVGANWTVPISVPEGLALAEHKDKSQSLKHCLLELKKERWIMSMKFLNIMIHHHHKHSDLTLHYLLPDICSSTSRNNTRPYMIWFLYLHHTHFNITKQIWTYWVGLG